MSAPHSFVPEELLQQYNQSYGTVRDDENKFVYQTCTQHLAPVCSKITEAAKLSVFQGVGRAQGKT